MVAFLGFRGQHEHRLADRGFPGHGAPAEGARAGAPRIFRRWPRLACPGRGDSSDWLRHAARQPPRRARERARPSGDESHAADRLQRRELITSTPGRWARTGAPAFPLEVTPQLMERGEQRFNINCAICHGATAAGNGITKQYGLTTVVTLQDERIRNMADGEIFNTITHGKNTMLAYGPNVTVNDRWAIIAYLRALQRSQNAADRARRCAARSRAAANWRSHERAISRGPDAGRRIFRERAGSPGSRSFSASSPLSVSA